MRQPEVSCLGIEGPVLCNGNDSARFSFTRQANRLPSRCEGVRIEGAAIALPERATRRPLAIVAVNFTEKAAPGA